MAHISDKDLQRALAERVAEAKEVFFDLYPTQTPIQIARFHTRISLMAELAADPTGLLAAPPPPQAQQQPMRLGRPPLQKRLAASHSVGKRAHTGGRQRKPPFAYVVKSNEFAELTQPAAIIQILARAKDGLTTDEVALALGEGGYPFKATDIMGVVSQAIVTLKAQGKVKGRLISGSKVKHRWLLAGTAKFSVTSA